MPVVNSKAANLPKAAYVVAVEVQNLHIGGVKVHKGDTVELIEPQARHWVNEGVLTPVAAPLTPGEAN
jgi:hypothetical protein